MTHLNKGCQAYLLVRNYYSSIYHTKKLFWVTRYSLGKTLSKELLIEHEFADDETRHRLIELHTPIDDERQHNFVLATVALFLNPPIGLIACMLICMAKRRSENMLNNYENTIYEGVTIRYAFIAYLLSIISIGLTVSTVTAILINYYIRDLKIVDQTLLNTISYDGLSSLKSTDIIGDQQQEQNINDSENYASSA